MITKFKCSSTNEGEEIDFIEFEKSGNKLIVEITAPTINTNLCVFLDKEQIFSLIGQLLRIQSEIREEVSNG